jgi:hypothetical protein
MEISVPTWNAKDTSYTFRVSKHTYKVESTIFWEGHDTELTLPATLPCLDPFLREFVQLSKKYFTNELVLEKIQKRLRHEVLHTDSLPSETNWFTVSFRPAQLIIKPAGEFVLGWASSEFREAQPVIPTDFLGSTTPRAHTPTPEQEEELRTIHVHDSLVPVGDLPLSDLPPLSFGDAPEDPAREEHRRRVREAKLKVALARLKAQRMEQKYYERYGEDLSESEDSSEFSSESEDEKFAGTYTS